MLSASRDTDEKISGLCEDISYSFITSSSVEPEFANLTGKDMSTLRENLCNYLKVNIREFLEENKLIEYD